MAEIKIDLNFFDKNNNLKEIAQELQSIKQLTVDISKQGDIIRKGEAKEIIKASQELEKLAALKKKTVREELLGSQKIKQERVKTIALSQKARAAEAKRSKAREVQLKKEDSLLGKLRLRVKELQNQQGFAKTEKEIIKINRQLQKAQQEVRKFSTLGKRDVNTFGNALTSFGFKFNILANTISTVGFAITRGIQETLVGTIAIFKDFEQANSNLQAVLGVTSDEMGDLNDNAKELGSTTAFTATEVVQLQTELAKLGFPTEDILKMTRATLNAAAAMGSELGETAKLVGSTLKAFGLDASETGRVTDVLSKSTSASALDFTKLSNSMSTIAPVANKFGFSIEATVSLLGELSNAGFDASSAATATRNILLNLADANGELAKRLKEPVKDLPSLVKGLKQLKEEGIDLGEALELTDRRSVAAFATFLDGTDSVLKLNETLEQAAGTAQEMADTQLDNLAGSITILNSAWEGFILSLEDGDGAFSKLLRSIVKTTTGLLGFLSGMDDAEEATFKNAVANQKLAKESQNLLNEYESLRIDGVEPTTEEKIKLEIITLQLKDRLGESVIAINKETGALELNTEAVRTQIKLKRFAADEEATTIASRLIGVQEEIKQQELIFKSETERRQRLQKQVDEQVRQQVENGKKLTKSDLDVRKFRDEANIAARKADKSLIEAKEKEAKFLAELKELNFELSDVEALFGIIKKETIEITESEITTLTTLKKRLSDLKDERQLINIEDKKALAINLSEIKSLQKLIASIEGLSKARKKASKERDDLLKREIAATKELEKIRIRLIEDERTREKEALISSFEFKINKLREDNSAEIELVKQLRIELRNELLKLEEKFNAEDEEALKEKLEKEQEIERKSLKIRNDLRIANIEDATEREKELANQRFEDEIARLEKEETITTGIRIALKKKLEKELAEIEKNARSEANKEALENTVDFAQEQIRIQQEVSKQRSRDLDDQVRKQEDNIDKLTGLDEEALEFELDKLDRLRAAREQEAIRQERLAKRQAYLNLLSAFSKDEPELAVFKAIAAIATSEAFLNGFKKAGYTGDGKEDDIAGVVHKGEMIQTAKQTTKYGMKGWSAKDFDSKIKEGYFTKFADTNLYEQQNQQFVNIVTKENKVGYDFSRLEEKLDLIAKRPIQQVDVKGMRDLQETIWKDGVKTVILHKNNWL